MHRPRNSPNIETENFTRTLQVDAKQREYVKTDRCDRTVCHWGQRKLLISEIEFLVEHRVPNCTILYVGAAPGTHIPYLSRLFPDVKFHLWDPCEFNIAQTDRIKIFRDYFTDETAKKYTDIPVLFISDIRTHIKDEYIAKDMECQRRWYETIKPHRAMLKFRFPYTPGETEYLSGEIKLPVWGPQTTTETRLIPDGGVKKYDHTVYERQMFHFNTVTRIAHYDHEISGEGICHCYDCRAEIHILMKYLENAPVLNLNIEIAHMSHRISRQLSKTRTLTSGTHKYTTTENREEIMITKNPNFKFLN